LCFSFHPYISNFIKSDAKVELAWLFVLLSIEINQVTDCYKECLQLKIPLDLFPGNEWKRLDSFYLLIPLSLLWQLKSLSNPELFADISKEESCFEMYSEKAIASLKGMLSNLLSKQSLNILMLAVLNKLKITPNKHSAHLLLQQIPNLSVFFGDTIPLNLIDLILKSIDDLKYLSVSPKALLIVIKNVLTCIPFNQLLSYEKSLPHPFITHFSIGLLQNFRKEFYERIDSQQFFQYLCRYQRFVFDSADFLTVRSEIQKKSLT
jgi:hypothetical protein